MTHSSPDERNSFGRHRTVGGFTAVGRLGDHSVGGWEHFAIRTGEQVSEGIIEVQDVTKRFGNVLAVDRCSLTVEKGSETGLIGPNGAGKTTVFNMLAGAFPPSSGRILLEGEDVTGLPAHRLFERDLLRTFQIAQEFSSMMALENLMMVPSGQSGESLLNAWFRRGAVRAEEAATRKCAEDVIAVLRLGHVKNELAGNRRASLSRSRKLGRATIGVPSHADSDAATVLLAIVLDRLFYRPLRASGAKPVATVMASIGVMLMLQGFVRLLAGTGTRQIEPGPKAIYRLSVGDGTIVITEPQLLLIGFTAFAARALHFFLSKSRRGKAMRAMADNADLARVSGIAFDSVTRTTWLLPARWRPQPVPCLRST